MIATDLQSLLREIRDARNRLKPHLETRKELIQHTAGRMYRQGEGLTSGTPDNYAYAFKSFVKPQLLFGKPKISVKAKSPQNEATAEALAQAVDYWTTENAFKDVLSEVLDDCFVGFGMTMCGVSPDPTYHGNGLGAVYDDFEQVPNYPFCVRVDPRRVILDGRASSLRESRLIGHSFEQDADDVAADARNDPAVTERLTGFADDDAKRDDAARAFPVPGNGEGERRRVTVHEVYLPEHKLLVAIAELGEGAADGLILRREVYWGPDEGPFTLWGLDGVAGELVPLSPLVALWDEYLEVVDHSRAAADSASTHKKIGVYGWSNKQDAEQIQRAKGGDMVGVNDPNMVRDFEIGGASDTQIKYIEYRRASLERDLGFGSAQQGVAGDKTATGESIAATNSDLRIDRMRDRVADGVSSVGRKIAWYFKNDANIAPMQMGIVDPVSGQSQPATMIPGPWQGGYVRGQFVPPERPTDDTDYDYNVDPSSMVKKDSAVEIQQAQNEFSLGVQLMGMGVPVNLRRLVDRLGEASGTKDLSKIIILDQAGAVLPLDPLSMGMPLGPRPGARPSPGGPGGRTGPGPQSTPTGAGGIGGIGSGPRGLPPGAGQPRPAMAGLLGSAQRVG